MVDNLVTESNSFVISGETCLSVKHKIHDIVKQLKGTLKFENSCEKL